MSVLEDLNYTQIWFMGMKSLMPCLGMSKKSYCQVALSSQPFQGDGQFFEMPVVWCKTNVYECLLFHNIYSAEHDAFYKAVHLKFSMAVPLKSLCFIVWATTEAVCITLIFSTLKVLLFLELHKKYSFFFC